MSRITKLELTQLLTKANAEIEALRLRVATLEGDKAALHTLHDEACKQIATLTAPASTGAKPVPQRTANKVVYEWDPKIPGDFKAKAELVKQFGGTMRRMQEQRA